MTTNYLMNIDTGEPLITKEDQNIDEIGRFGQVIRDDPNTVRTKISMRQPNHEVDIDLLLLPLMNRSSMKQSSQSRMLSHHFLKIQVICYKICHILLQTTTLVKLLQSWYILVTLGRIEYLEQ